jgi:tripartite-type tricarboxylate transporter receptor subunit TctC
MRTLHRLLAFGLLGLAALQTAAHAETFPNRPVRIIVPTGAGGGLDQTGRLIAQKLSELWGQGVVVDNRVGAGGTIGIDAVAKAAPDGYTIGVFATAFVINASIYSKLPYDSLRDFAPISLVSYSPLVLVVNPSLPVHSVADLVALAKEKPGQINYSSTGTGGGVHLAIEMLRGLTGINVVHIPYKSTVAAVTDVIEGQVQFTVTGLPVAMPMVTAGRLRNVAIAGTMRSPAAPDLPTISETVPGYVFNNWIGVLAPARTPPEVLAKLHDSILQIMQSPDLLQKMKAQGDVPATNSAAEFGDMIKREIATYGALVKSTGAKID